LTGSNAQYRAFRVYPIAHLGGHFACFYSFKSSAVVGWGTRFLYS